MKTTKTKKVNGLTIFAGMLMYGNVGQETKDKFFALPKEEQTADRLFSIAIAKFAFKLYTEQGFPLELTLELLNSKLQGNNERNNDQNKKD